jgi:glycosyltransferase involved in cell wall biosynthesis
MSGDWFERWAVVWEAVRTCVDRSNRAVREYWAVLVGSAISLAGVVSLIKSKDDHQWTETNTVSTAPLDGDELVSVLMPAWNEGATVAQSIAAFRELSYPHRELIVCAGGDDDTYEHAVRAGRGDDRIQVREQTAAMNKQAALNACLAAASGEVLYLVDGDCILEDATWNAALRPVIEGTETVVAGTSRPLNEQWGRLLPTYQHVKETYERARRPRYVQGLLGRNAVVRATAMAELGTFDESIQAGTDYNLAKRLLTAGHEIRFVPNSRIQSAYPTTVRAYFDQQSRWLRNVFFLGREWREYREATTTVVTCLVGAGMVVAPLVGLVFLPILPVWFGLVCYGAFSRLRWVRFFRAYRDRPVPSRVIVAGIGLMFVEFTAWAYALVEILVPSRRRKW